MSEIRQDGMTGEWVIIAPERGRRPRQLDGCDLSSDSTSSDSTRRYDPSCPFCPGNEAQLAGIVEESPLGEPPGWRTRVVLNKFPAVFPEGECEPSASGAHRSAIVRGFHEVIIETSRHDADLTTVSEEQLAAVLQTYRRRYVELIARLEVKSVLVFRNHGARAGASLPHPHSQVIATDMTPPRSAATAAWSAARFARDGRCPACMEIEIELADGQRIVELTDRFLAIVPFAATGPFEQRILPRTHQATFAQCCDGELIELGRLLQRSLRRLRSALGDPPYKFVIECGSREKAVAAFMHWWLRIVPDLVTPGGFELGAGMPINPSWPEEDAAVLRAAAATAMEETP